LKRKYPLESLRLVRQREKEASEASLAAAIEKRKVAEGAALRARTDRERAGEELRVRLSMEAVRVDGGEARAGDLARTAAYQSEAERRVRSHELVEAAGKELAVLANVAESGAREELGRARGAERAVEEHRLRFEAVEREGAERRDEAEAEDTWNAARARAGKRSNR
jgi:hypothetical protein